MHDSGASGRPRTRGCRSYGRRRCSRTAEPDAMSVMTEYPTGGFSMKRSLQDTFALVAALLLMVSNASAQVDRATLTGTVRDTSMAVVPGATVTVRNVATNVSSEAVTDAQGNFLVGGLIPGSYVVEVELAGFQKSSGKVDLEVGQRSRLDFTLSVGTVEQTVIVQASSPIINTEQATLGSVIPQSQVANLPLSIRNWDDLLALVPGVEGDRYTEQGGGTSFGRTGGINVHGARALQNNFLLDGVDNNSISENVQELTSQVSRPSVDAIQEFKVVTSPYSAEYGRSPGGAISVSTKSGTNEIHGTAYDFFRNDRFDSNDFFSKRAGLAKPANDQNQFGGNLGGPLVKDKAFFFVDYEGTRIKRGVTRVIRTFTAEDRHGIFSSTVKYPLTGQPFPGDRIAESRFDPLAVGLMALVPLPTQPGAANNSTSQPNITDDSDRLLGRLDVRFSSNDSVFARYIYSNRHRDIPGLFTGVIDGTSTSAFGNQKIKTSGVVAGWTRIFSPTNVNEFRFSWSHAQSDAVQEPFD